MNIKKASRRNVKVLSLPGRDAWMLVSKESLGSKTISFGEVHIKPGEYTNPPHAHLDFEEVIYVKRGMAEIWIEGQLEQLRRGEAVLIPTNAKHAIRNIGKWKLVLLCALPCPDRAKGHVNYEGYEIPQWTKVV